MGGTKRKSTGVGKRIAAGLLSLSLAFSNLPLVAPRAALAEPAVTKTYPSVREHIAEKFSQDIAEEVADSSFEAEVEPVVQPRLLLSRGVAPVMLSGPLTSTGVTLDEGMSSSNGSGSEAPEADDLAETGHFMTVRYLLADSTRVSDGDTIDSVWEKAGGAYEDSVSPAIVGQLESVVPIYDAGLDDVWVAFIDSTVLSAVLSAVLVSEDGFVLAGSKALAVHGLTVT